jgi:hypothetical protein
MARRAIRWSSSNSLCATIPGFPSRERIEEHRRLVSCGNILPQLSARLKVGRSIFLNPHRRRAVEAHMRLRKTI